MKGKITRLDRPADLDALNARLDELEKSRERPHRPFVPGAEPQEEAGTARLWYDTATGKFKFKAPDGTVRTLQDS